MRLAKRFPLVASEKEMLTRLLSLNGWNSEHVLCTIFWCWHTEFLLWEMPAESWLWIWIKECGKFPALLVNFPHVSWLFLQLPINKRVKLKWKKMNTFSTRYSFTSLKWWYALKMAQRTRITSTIRFWSGKTVGISEQENSLWQYSYFINCKHSV